MGAKFSKSSKGEKKWDEMKVNGKTLPENFDKTSTLPASFRRRDDEVVMTGTLPRSLQRNQSFSKRFRKSCKNWAAQRGLIDPCKATETETQSQVPTKPSSVVLAQEECKDKITDVAQELPEVVITKAQSLDMLVQPNAVQIEASFNEDSVKTDPEAICEVEALANSAKAEIVIEAQFTDIDKSELLTKDSSVNDCELEKKEENDSEETNISPLVEKVQIENETPELKEDIERDILEDILESQITEKEEITEPNVIVENTLTEEPSEQILENDMEPVVEEPITENETPELKEDIERDILEDILESQITEKEEITEPNVIVENALTEEPSKQILENDMQPVVEKPITVSSNEVNESETVGEKEELNTETKQEVIDRDDVSSTELQVEKSENLTDIIIQEKVIQEGNEITEEVTSQEVVKETETSLVQETNAILEEVSWIEVAQETKTSLVPESVDEEELITKEVIQETNEIVEEVSLNEVVKETETSLVPDRVDEEELITTEVIQETNEIAEEVCLKEVTENTETFVPEKEEHIKEIDIEIIDVEVSSTEVNEEQNEDLTNNTITTEEVIQEGNEITEELSLKEVAKELNAVETQVDDASEPEVIIATKMEEEVKTVVCSIAECEESGSDEKDNKVNDSINEETISSNECEKEIINEDQNSAVAVLDEVVENVGGIAAPSDKVQDKIADNEEDSHEVEITEDNKSEKAIEEDKNNSNISADECIEQETCLAENCEEQEEICTDKKQDDEINDHVVEDVPCAGTEKEIEETRTEEVIVNTSVAEIEKEEDVSESNDILSVSDGIWKCQWNLPCLDSYKVDEESPMTMPTPDAEEISTELEPQQFELSNEEELNAMNEQLDSANIVIQRTDNEMESVSENESKGETDESVEEDEEKTNLFVNELEESSVTPCEQKEVGSEKKTEAVNDELEIPECESATQFEGESNISLPELEEVEIKTDEENRISNDAEPSSLESLEDENGDEVIAITHENKHVETAMKDILTDIVDNIASKSEITSLENVSDAPADDLISEGGSDGCVSTDEGIAASDDDDKDSVKSDELKKDNAQEITESEIKIENLITEIDQHP